MTDDIVARLRPKCFGGPLHCELAPATTARVFKAASKREDAWETMYAENAPLTVQTLEWGEYSLQVFGQTHWKTVNDPRYDKPLTLWQRFLVWFGLHRKLTEDEKPKLHFIGRRQGYLYVWKWDGKPFEVNTRMEDLIVWDEIVWERAPHGEVPHGWEATDMEVQNAK